LAASLAPPHGTLGCHVGNHWARGMDDKLYIATGLQ